MQDIYYTFNNRMKPKEKIKFIYLTKNILEFQNTFNYNLLDPNENIDLKNNNIGFLINNTEFGNSIGKIYKDYKLFMDVKNYINITDVFKPLDNIPYKNLDPFVQKHYEQFFKCVMLINLINNCFKARNLYDLYEFDLFSRLNNLEVNIVDILDLEYLVEKYESGFTEYIKMNLDDNFPNNWYQEIVSGIRDTKIDHEPISYEYIHKLLNLDIKIIDLLFDIFLVF